MARPTKSRVRKPAIFVFYEGESEEAYMGFVKTHFQDKAVISIHPKKGLFYDARNAFESNAKYRSLKEEIDEIWFFFDTEVEMRNKWEDYLNIIRALRNLNKHKIRVRLLMTTTCIEYFLMLHYKKLAPSLALPSDKNKILNQVQEIVPFIKRETYLQLMK